MPQTGGGAKDGASAGLGVQGQTVCGEAEFGGEASDGVRGRRCGSTDEIALGV